MSRTMRVSFLALTLVLSCSLVGVVDAARTYPPNMPDAKAVVYKTIDDVEMKLFVFTPKGHQATDRRAAVVFFFGGGWTSGSPQQFEPFCQALAERGMVAISADYRVASRHGVKAVDCVRDAKSAIRYVREHADELGVDPDRIAAGGGSAGGHLAAAVGTIEAFDEEDEDRSISSRPNAMLLCNPAVVLAPIDGELPANKARIESLQSRMGVAPETISPYHNIDGDEPPTVIFHGTKDTTVPYRTVELFDARMREKGVDCRLMEFEGRGHGFFNPGRDEDANYEAVLAAMEEFLEKHGFIDPVAKAE